MVKEAPRAWCSKGWRAPPVRGGYGRTRLCLLCGRWTGPPWAVGPCSGRLGLGGIGPAAQHLAAVGQHVAVQLGQAWVCYFGSWSGL